MSGKRVIFVAFAIEDERQRDFLRGQTLHARRPYEFVDIPAREPYASGWKDRARTRIRRSHGVIALVSKNSLASSGQKREIQCAKDEGKPIQGIWPTRTTEPRCRGWLPPRGVTPASEASLIRPGPCEKH